MAQEGIGLDRHTERPGGTLRIVVGIVLQGYLLDGDDPAELSSERLPGLDLLQQQEIGGESAGVGL